ncbi:MAG: hypothetical protein U1A72_03455 [Sulfuritalea sp.]|nr:hypothetical protein [Sulfuritalea sp.]
MAEQTSKPEGKSILAAHLQQWIPPAITALLGLVAGIVLAAYNSDLATNRFFLERQAKTADNVAVEFSRYVENWSRLMRLRRHFDATPTEPTAEERDNFKRVVFERSNARDKLFSSLDSVHLYYSPKVSGIVVEFRAWDYRQSELTIDKLPDIKEWQQWQIDILRALREEIRK